GLGAATLLRLPGASNPMSAKLIERYGFDGVYVSGALISAELGLGDIGLTTLTEVAAGARQIVRVTRLPALVDADIGFAGSMNAATAVQVLESAGVAGLHIEDQVAARRPGIRGGREVMDAGIAVRRIKAAVAARQDPSFVIVARTGAAAARGIDEAVDRARAYADAGANLIFPAGMTNAADFERIRGAVDVPIVADMAEFGPGRLLDARTLRNLGINVVIYPLTLLRLAVHATAEGLTALAKCGTQEALLDRMQLHRDLFDLLG
ncbi:MAG TPA: isocitrate lyase/phosphoenolpyruvate mutase family protein, partial [Trebonia sp.]|nr:isocitrate lyase/phosphoenolpyruvate mutase family protein [Trebonia sp.]